MKVNPDVVYSILIKEIQDLRKNTNLLVMYLIPLLLTLVWRYFVPEMPQGFALSFGLLFLVVMVGMYVPSMIIAEEKEKNTLEILLLSPATPVDVLLGKALLTFISIIVVAIILMLITGLQGENLFIIFLATVLISVFSIFVGMMIGLVAPDQRSTGTTGLPVYLLLLLVPQLAAMSGESVLNLLARFLPTTYYFEILNLALVSDEAVSEYIFSLGFIMIYIVLSFFILIYIYRRKGLN